MTTPRKGTSKRNYRYQLRVELQDISPIIWRLIWVESNLSLVQLHHVVQAAMGWSDAHLHEFTIDDMHYATPHPEDDLDRPLSDERRVRLHTLLKPGLEFEYLYDFGDSWQHTIRVERAESVKELYGYAHIEAGSRACPPDDCGGPCAYQAFLDQLKTDPRNEEVTEFLNWAGNDFDPSRFDRHAANATLSRMAWNRWGTK
ncbi:plasmid pRiA4b ORF-3 family protein [Methyloterricola oryzae]|uniref:plasmid pRiA4b ORF-3 family protein n=1 Tax=Methyloterricola oryzae TaxID=1495050 RepID=UPI0005EB2BF6|nr:plasmid pRiA4b ORF-3 family protein [Methyloterricola oryzae]